MPQSPILITKVPILHLGVFLKYLVQPVAQNPIFVDAVESCITGTRRFPTHHVRVGFRACRVSGRAPLGPPLSPITACSISLFLAVA